MANVKLGNNTLTGVTTVRLQNADAAGEYVSFNDLVAQEKTAAVTTNGTTEVTPDSGKTLSKVTITTNVPTGGAELNITYSDAAPTDTSKLWINSEKPDEITFTANPEIGGAITSLGALPTETEAAAAGVVGTKIYLFGGYSPSLLRLNTINVFDTTSNTISTLSTTLPTKTEAVAAGVVGTKIYLFGGYKSASSGHLNTINVFDTTSNTISTLSTTLPTAAQFIAAGVVGTKIYLFGGLKSSGSYLNTINVFDTTSNTISTLSTTLPTAAHSIAAGVVGTKIYLFGGNTSSGTLNTINVFDTTSNTISTLSITLPIAVSSIAAGVVGTKIYLFGGYKSESRVAGILINTINVFDTTSNTISTLSTTLPTVARSIAAGVVGTKIYLCGGDVPSGGLNTINVFVGGITLGNGDILVLEDTTINVFNLLTAPTKIEMGIKNVYKGNASNIAELCDAYLHDGTNWVNVNTGVVYSA